MSADSLALEIHLALEIFQLIGAGFGLYAGIAIARFHLDSWRRKRALRRSPGRRDAHQYEYWG